MHFGVRENPGRNDNLDNDNDNDRDAEGILLVSTLQRRNAVRPRKPPATLERRHLLPRWSVGAWEPEGGWGARQ